MTSAAWNKLFNFYKGVSDEGLVDTENECLLRTGIDPDCIEITDVILDPKIF